MLYSKWKKIKKGWNERASREKKMLCVHRPTSSSHNTLSTNYTLLECFIYCHVFIFLFFFLLLSMDITTFFFEPRVECIHVYNFFFVLCSLYHSSTLENRKRRRNKWARNINIVIVTWSTRESLQINTIRYCGVNSLFFFIYILYIHQHFCFKCSDIIERN